MAEKTNVGSSSREILTGDGLGITYYGDVAHVSREILTGARLGATYYADVASVTRDMLTGDRLGILRVGDVASVVRETLIKEPPIRVATVVRESLVSVVGEALSVQRIVRNYRQAAVMVRPAMPLPSTVRSTTVVPTLREHVVLGAVRAIPVSVTTASTLAMSVAMKRAGTAPRSMSMVVTLQQQLLVSRGKQYVPVSALFVTSQRQMVITHRITTPANEIRTPIRAGTLRQVVLMSKRAAPVFTEAHAATLVQQIVVELPPAVPYSSVAASTLVHMTLQRRDVTPRPLDNKAGTLREHVVMQRVPVPPMGADIVRSLVQQSVVQRIAANARGQDIVAGVVSMAVTQRFTYPPQYAMGRHATSFTSMVVQQRIVDATQRSPISAASLRVAFVVGRDTLPPWEVIDPAIGRHTAGLMQLTLQRREFQPPISIMESRWVHGVHGQVVLSDKSFPPPEIPQPTHESVVTMVGQISVHRDRDGWAPVSAVKTAGLIETPVLGDAEGWIDATIPQSAVDVVEIAQAVAHVDAAFPDPLLPQSDAVLTAVGEQIVLGDAMPDPLQPLSDVDVHTVAEFAAVGDADWSDPRIPLSDLTVSRVASFAALHDPSLVGAVDGSEVRIESVAEFYVTRDPTMKGVPLRQGPRPVVTVTIS